MTLSERIKAIVDYSGLSIPKYAQAIGVQTPQAIRDLISGKTKSISENIKSKILSYTPEINASWLFTGEGKMLNVEESISQNHDSDEDENSSSRLSPFTMRKHQEVIAGLWVRQLLKQRWSVIFRPVDGLTAKRLPRFAM